MSDLELSPELNAMLYSTPILSERDIQELADANRALASDPDFIADGIKAHFVNDILIAMEEQGVNRNQLAMKWGKSRQHVSQILDAEKTRNFTIDTIVGLSMSLGLVPQRIELKKILNDDSGFVWRTKSMGSALGSSDFHSVGRDFTGLASAGFIPSQCANQEAVCAQNEYALAA